VIKGSSACARMGGLGQAQYDLLVPFDKFGTIRFFRATTNVTEATERTRSKHRAGIVSEASGQCEVIAKCERTPELPQNAERKRLAPTRMTEERADRISPLCYTQITSPFWRSEAAETKL